MASIRWVDEDFDKNIFVEVNNAAIPIAQNMGSWCGQAIAGAGGTSNVSWAQVDNVLGHVGILRIPTGATSGNNSRLFLARDSQVGGPSTSEAHVSILLFRRMEAWVRVPTITSVVCGIGMGQDISNVFLGSNSFFFHFDPSTSANWLAIRRTASVNNITDTGVPVTAGVWYKLTLHKASDRWFCGVNVNTPHRNADTIVTNHNGLTLMGTATTPNGNMLLGARVETSTSTARNFDIDRVRVWLDEAAMVG